MMGYFSNVLFDNVNMPNQKLLIRKQWGIGDARDITFRNSNINYEYVD